MNEAIVFDTHRFVRNLTASGFTERQAEALANEQVQLLNANLATKADIAAVQADVERVRSDLEAKLAAVQADLEVKIANVQSDLETRLAAVQADVERVQANLEVKLANVQSNLEVKLANLDAKIASSKSDTLKWMFAALIAQSGIIVTLITLFT